MLSRPGLPATPGKPKKRSARVDFFSDGESIKRSERTGTIALGLEEPADTDSSTKRKARATSLFSPFLKRHALCAEIYSRAVSSADPRRAAENQSEQTRTQCHSI